MKNNKEETLDNFINFVQNLVKRGYNGELTVKFNQGTIAIGEKKDKVKFDTPNYLEYQANIFGII
jgi:hypothetical protein